jgi:hypothetical protein
MIAMTAALLLVVGVAPAYADEDDTTDTTEAPEIEAVESDEESEGSHLNGKLLVLFSRGFDFSKGSALGELIDEYLEEGSGEGFDWGNFDQWLADGEIADGVPFELSDEQRTLIETFVDSPPKNFGALVSALRQHHGRNENSPVYAAAENGETKKGKKPDHAGTDGDDDDDDGNTFDTEASGDEENGKGKNSDHPNKGKKSDHPNKGGKKNNS